MKHYSSVFINFMGNTVTMGLMIGNSNNWKMWNTLAVERKGNILKLVSAIFY